MKSALSALVIVQLLHGAVSQINPSKLSHLLAKRPTGVQVNHETFKKAPLSWEQILFPLWNGSAGWEERDEEMKCGYPFVKNPVGCGVRCGLRLYFRNCDNTTNLNYGCYLHKCWRSAPQAMYKNQHHRCNVLRDNGYVECKYDRDCNEMNILIQPCELLRPLWPGRL